MSKFCPKCGATLKPGAKFCPSCGFSFEEKPEGKEAEHPQELEPKPEPEIEPEPESIQPIEQVQPQPQPQPVPAGPDPYYVAPPPAKSSGCGVGCLVGCLIALVVFLIIVGIIVAFVYYFLTREKEPGSYFEIDSQSKGVKSVECTSAACLENNLKICSPAQGETEIGDFAEAEFQILGKSEDNKDSCVVFFKITEIKEMPPGMDFIPKFVLEKMFDNLSLECLVPEKIYKQGIEEFGEYISENMVEVCKGPLFDVAEKFGVDLEDLKD